MGAGIANLSLFWSMVLNAQILGLLNSFADTFHMRPNADLDKVLRECSLGTPVSLILIGFFLAYMCFAARDAYEHAAQRRRKLYPDSVIDLPEATSGAYLAHFATMAALLLIAFLFILPPPKKSQITEIEFVTDQEEVKKQIKSPRKAQKNSEDSGKHDPTKKVAPPSPSANKASQQSQQKQQQQQQPKQSAPRQPSPQPPSPRPTPTPQRMAPSPSPSPSPAPRAMPTPTPMPRVAPAPVGMPAPVPTPMAAPRPMSPSMPTLAPNPLAKAPGMPTPAPMARPTGGTANGLPTIAPAPVGIASALGVPGFAPVPTGGATKGGGAFGSTAPAPIAVGGGGTGGTGRGAPAPVPVAGGGGSRQGSGSGPAAAPAPTRASTGGGGGTWGSGPVVVTPSVPRAGGSGGGDGAAGNPGPNSNPNGRPSVAAQADVDFGPYMADLQRRIKKCWFPPRGNESKRVVVVFKVHTDGTLSDLRIDKSSTVAVADQAALKAVNDAAPFRPLPPGAPSDVDIQFTFDYNVFGGGGTGRFRQF